MSNPSFHAGGMTIEFLIEGEQTDNAISIFRCDFTAGARVPLAHSHDGFDETVVVLDGEMTMVVDGKPRALRAGDTLHVPRGVVHGFVVEKSASIIAISTPGIFGSAYFQEMQDAMNAMGDGPPDRRVFAQIMLRHGLTPVLPATV